MPFDNEDIPVLQEISTLHGCKNNSREFWELMFLDYNDHCFVFRQSSDLHCITGFIIATNDQILELVTGYKYKNSRYWLLRACKQSYEFGTVLKFTMSKQLESEMEKNLKNLDFVKSSENENQSTYMCNHILHPFRCGSCDDTREIVRISDIAPAISYSTMGVSHFST
jgi:hypothetical protein